MTVPFEKLGPGQSGRLAYQVMGKNGPIYNPKGIRYLAPSETPSFLNVPPTLPSAFTSLSVANLTASVASAGISTAVLRQVQKLHLKADIILDRAISIDNKVNKLIEKVDRIDAKVSENNLRHALSHVLNRSVNEEEIDLAGLARIKNDLEAFAEGIEEGFLPYSSFGLRLSSDVADSLESIYKILFGVRYFIYSQHNLVSNGDPLNMLSLDLVDDYLPGEDVNSQFAATMRKALVRMWQAQGEIGEKVMRDFMWADQNKADEYNKWLGENVTQSIYEMFCGTDNGLMDLALRWETDLSDEDETLGYYQSLRMHWLWNTSAGLLYRTYVETLGIIYGYEETWRLEGKKLKEIKNEQLYLSSPESEDELSSILSDYNYSGVRV